MRDFPLVGVRRADAGPAQRAHRIVCSSCRAEDFVINGGPNKVVPTEIVAKRFTRAGWSVGARDDRDLCPTCAAKRAPVRKEVLPMIKVTKPVPPPLVTASPPTRSEDARKARLDVDMLLVDHFDPAKGRYHDGWDDERVGKEAGMSVEFVAKRREAEHGALRRDVAGEALAALAAEFTARELALRGRMATALRDVAAAVGALREVVAEANATFSGHAEAIRALVDGKGGPG